MLKKLQEEFLKLRKFRINLYENIIDPNKKTFTR